MTTQKAVTHVRIFGTEYPVKGDGDSDYVRSIADYVNRKMVEVDATMSNKAALKTAILVAMNIADELFKERQSQAGLVEEINQRVQTLSDTVQVSLGDTH